MYRANTYYTSTDLVFNRTLKILAVAFIRVSLCFNRIDPAIAILGSHVTVSCRFPVVHAVRREVSKNQLLREVKRDRLDGESTQTLTLIKMNLFV